MAGLLDGRFFTQRHRDDQAFAFGHVAGVQLHAVF